MNKLNLQTGILIAIIFIAAFCRLIPHTANFSPLGAIGLFGAAHFAKKWQAYLIPLAAVWFSDLFINNVIYTQHYTEFTWFYGGFYWQYGTYILIVILGILLFKKNKISFPKVLGGALGASVVFFLITNFGCWPGNPVYAKSIGGLMSCFAAGIPFFKGTLMGDLFYTTVLFGGYYLLQRRFIIFKLPHIQYA